MAFKADLPPVPPALADVALIDGPTCAAVGQVCTSAWLDEVRAKRAPQPVIRGPRCTRWKLQDVRAYWAARAEQGTESKAAQAVLAQATKASKAAAEKRKATAAAAQ